MRLLVAASRVRAAKESRDEASFVICTAGRDTIIGPGSVVLNLSLSRSINLKSERRRLEFRVDTNNFLNHVNPAGLTTS